MLHFEEDLPKTNIKLVLKDINPVFDNEESELLKEKVYSYLRKKEINFDNLDDYTKIKVVQKLIGGCKRCDLRYQCKSPVEPVINVNPKVGFLVRNPAVDEEKIGVPLHPEASGGSVFSKYLQILGVQRYETYISNILQCRTEKSKSVNTSYIAKCALWKSLEFDIIEIPKYIITMGSYPLKLFMGFNYPSITSIFGDIYKTNFRGKGIYIIPITHPGFMLRNSSFREQVDEILKWVRVNLIDKEGF